MVKTLDQSCTLCHSILLLFHISYLSPEDNCSLMASWMQPVAIKQMLNPDQKAKSEFLKEITLLKHVSLDANIVQYFGACFQEDELWLVTEYMEVSPKPNNGQF